jgi:hypothetical protein
MPIDPRKLVAMMRQGKPNESGYTPGAGQEHHARQGEPEDDEDARLLNAGYMEQKDLAGAFSCGNCTWANTEEERCENPAVNAPVSGEHGCCNLFGPVDAQQVTFPVDYKDPRAATAE